MNMHLGEIDLMKILPIFFNHISLKRRTRSPVSKKSLTCVRKPSFQSQSLNLSFPICKMRQLGGIAPKGSPVFDALTVLLHQG